MRIIYKKIVKEYPTKQKLTYSINCENRGRFITETIPYEDELLGSSTLTTIVDCKIRESCKIQLLEDGTRQSVSRKTGEVQREVSAEEYSIMQSRNFKSVKDKICDYIDCNNFDFFGTLTFEFGQDNEQRCKKFTHWANYMGKLYPDFKYFCMKEKHKSGLLHFHLLIKGLPLDLLTYSGRVVCSKLVKGCCKESVYKKIRFRKKRTDGLKIYNLDTWRNGFSNFTKIVDIEATRRYLTKYVTKDICSASEKNKKKYYCSKGLSLPKKRVFLYPAQEYSSRIDHFAFLDLKVNKMQDIFLKEDYSNYKTHAIGFTYTAAELRKEVNPWALGRAIGEPFSKYKYFRGSRYNVYDFYEVT